MIPSNAKVRVMSHEMKARSIRLYSDAIKTLYGEGPCRISDEFKDHQCTYDEWKSMEKERRENVVNHFFNARQQQIPPKRNQDLVGEPSCKVLLATVHP